MRRRGFTLIELLVVIAVISVLISLTVSSLRAAREQARAVACASNLKQLLLAMDVYETENGTFPPGFSLPNAGSYGKKCAGSILFDLPGWWWFDRVLELNHTTMDGVDVLTCPSKRQGDSKLSGDVLCGNYGANLSICRVTYYLQPYKSGFYGEPLSQDRIRRPSETLLAVDSGYSLISWWHVTEEPPVTIPSDSSMVQHTAYVPGMGINRDKPLWAGQAEDAIGGRHPNKTVNVGFVDGSVGVKRQADSLLVTRGDDEQWASSPLWQPAPDPVSDSVTPTATLP